MPEDVPPPSPTAGRSLAGRLRERRTMIVASGLALAALAASGELTFGPAALAFAFIFVAALLLPEAGARAQLPAAGAAGSEPLAGGETRAFADALLDPCLILDTRGIIMHRNPVAARDFPNARAGDPLVFSFRSPAMLSALESARTSGTTQVVELHQTVPNETWHKVVVAPLALAGAGRRSRSYIVSLQSLTEQKRVDAMRADFVANASHELRTPLASLMGFIDTLLGPAAKDAAAREKFLRIMRGQAERMSKLVDDLLSLGRIEMRQHVRPTGSVDLTALLVKVRDGLQTQAGEAGAEIALAMPDEPVTVTGDREELYEVFENLIENALKYGGDGGRIDVAVETISGRPGYDVGVTITDHGPGVAPEHVPRLTERFYRVDAESSRSKKGTGLGLAIVKHIVHRHHGQLSIRSRRGQGTTVEVLLPR